MNPSQNYKLTVRSNGLLLVAGLNGVPIAEDTDASGVSGSYAVNEWLMPGHNRLTARLEWPEDVPFADGLATVEAALWPPGDRTRPTAVFHWPLPDTPEGYPYSAQVDFMMHSPPPCRLWMDTDTTEVLTAETRAAALAPVLELYAALEARKADAAADILAFRCHDMAVAYHSTPDGQRRLTREFFSDLFSVPEFQLVPITTEKLQLRPVANRKLHLVTQGNEDAILIYLGEGMIFKLRVYVACVRGAWRIAR